MKNNRFVKQYRVLGYILCGFAGGVIGFMTGGIALALIGILPGMFVAHLLEKSLMKMA